MAEPDNDTTGRCISCGFLAHHSELLNQHLREVEPESRERPDRSYGPSMVPGRKGLASYLICFLRKADLFAEVDALITRDPKKGTFPIPLPIAVEEVLRDDRRCPYYLRYEIGLSPKEHLMERRLLGLEEDRRAFQIALDRGSKRLMWAALILGSLLAAGQLLAAFFATPDAYGARWLRGLWPPPPPPGLNDRV